MNQYLKPCNYEDDQHPVWVPAKEYGDEDVLKEDKNTVVFQPFGKR